MKFHMPNGKGEHIYQMLTRPTANLSFSWGITCLPGKIQVLQFKRLLDILNGSLAE